MQKMLHSILPFLILSSYVSGVNAVPPMERIGHTEPTILSNDLNLICCYSHYETTPNERLFIQSILTNNQLNSQSFVFIVKISDDENVTVMLAWVKTNLVQNTKTNLTQSWIPDEAGHYTVETFVWNSLEKPEALSSIKSVDVAVVPEHVGDFSISVTPSRLVLEHVESANARITVSSFGGFNYPVNLTFDESYPCLETVFSPQIINLSSDAIAHSIMTIMVIRSGEECERPDTYTDTVYMVLAVNGNSLDGLMRRSAELVIEIPQS